MTQDEQNQMDALSKTVTELCSAIDPKSIHGPETAKIVAHAKAMRFAVRLMVGDTIHLKIYHPVDYENLRRLDVLDAMDEPKPEMSLLLDSRTFPNDKLSGGDQPS